MYKRKSEHWLLKHLSPRMWTTWRGKVYVPQHIERELSTLSVERFERKYKAILDHERVHVRQQQRLTMPLFLLCYIGPSPLVALSALVFGLNALILAALLMPLSIGLAYGRWRLELPALLAEIGPSPTEERIDAEATTLASLQYGHCWPKGLIKKCLYKQLR